jgi:hypothetical protein
VCRSPVRSRPDQYMIHALDLTLGVLPKSRSGRRRFRRRTGRTEPEILEDDSDPAAQGENLRVMAAVVNPATITSLGGNTSMDGLESVVFRSAGAHRNTNSVLEGEVDVGERGGPRDGTTGSRDKTRSWAHQRGGRADREHPVIDVRGFCEGKRRVPARVAPFRDGLNRWRPQAYSKGWTR